METVRTGGMGTEKTQETEEKPTCETAAETGWGQWETARGQWEKVERDRIKRQSENSVAQCW